jgi:hypothetical protein
MQQKPEFELSEIVASIIATTVASGLMAAAGLVEATAQVPDATDNGTTRQPDPKRSAVPVTPVEATR